MAIDPRAIRRLLSCCVKHFVRLLDQGEIPFTRAGTHRRVRIDDVLTYKQHRDRERLDSLDELARLSQKYGGYDELP